MSVAGKVDQEELRRAAWDIGERQPSGAYVPPHNHVGLAVVAPAKGFAHWRVTDDWVGRTSQERGDAWRNCTLILRLYDVSFIEFNGLNAHRIVDHRIPSLCGTYFFDMPKAGGWQIAEVGFLLRNGEFIPAARSQSVSFPPASPTAHTEHTALLVEEDLHVEHIGNLWEQDRILHERHTPKLRERLKIAAMSFDSLVSGQQGSLATFVTELAKGLASRGQEVHLFVPASEALPEPAQVDGVNYHPVKISNHGAPLTTARAFAKAVEPKLDEAGPFDVLHVHEWMPGQGSVVGSQPTILSLSSIEAVRHEGAGTDEHSELIAEAERELAHKAHCVLAPDWLREKLIRRYELDHEKVRPFAMEGRLPNEWEAPLDFGQVKGEIHVGPLDRLLIFVGPLDHAAGPDLLIDAMPILLHRAPNLRLAIVGDGPMRGHLEHLIGKHGVGYAVRLLGHVQGAQLHRLLRAAEALVLPSRYRVPMDDAVIDLARRAARPVVTTHAGPSHLVRHEETGIVTYDNPGSVVWAVDRILGDAGHAEAMGRQGSYHDGLVINWNEVAGHYLEICRETFPELTVRRERKRAAVIA
jgi:glycosyltransferase involved in cell wall biosynthesis